MSENTSNISGDGNVVLQDINARDVVINIAGDLPPEVKQKKESLNEKIKGLVDQLDGMKEKIPVSVSSEPFEPPDDPAYQGIKWRRLLKALEHQGCVLFVGPEIAIDDQGKSLHQEFYKELAEDFDDIEYMENEGFFSPEADEEILYDILDFYKKDFPRENKKGRQLLEQLAQLPFSMTVSLCPDDTMHTVFEDYAMPHNFLFYDGTKQELEPNGTEMPIIYNILGNAAENGKYIFTHANFFQYLNKVTIPSEIKKKIQDATHFLFVGFDFDKWYNRLLLFILDFEQRKGGGNRMIVGSQKIKEDIELFIEKQFSITFIENDYTKFIEWLTANAADAGLLRNLNATFLQNNFLDLKKISIKISDEDKLEELTRIEKQVEAIDERIQLFKKRTAA